MKRLFLILTIAISILGLKAQNLGTTTLTSRYDVSTTGDTLLRFPYDMEFKTAIWRVDVVWDSLSGTLNGAVKIKTSSLHYPVEDSTFVDYPNMSSVTLNSAQGECSFEDTYFSGRRLGVFFDKNSITGGVLKVYVTIKK